MVANLFIDNAFLIVLAVGMTFVILTGGIDLSVGAVVALSTMVTAPPLQAGWPAPLVSPAVLVIGSMLGLLMGLVIHHFEIQPFIVDPRRHVPRPRPLLRDQRRVDPDQGRRRSAPSPRHASRCRAASPSRWTASWPLVVVAVAAWVLHRTRFGRTVYAIGGSESSALLMGLRGRPARRSAST